LWIVVLLTFRALWVALDRMVMPTVRWYVRRKINRAISQVNTRLRMTMRPFHLTKRQVLIDRLVYDSQVIDAMRTHASEEGIPEEIAQSKVIQVCEGNRPRIQRLHFFQFGYWLNRKLSRLLYRVRVRLLDEKLIQDIDPEATIVFTMNHRSNMDYILISYLVNKQSTISYAVGEWAQVWPLNTLIKAMGAFFVRRNSNNPLYRAVLQRYIHMATKEGVAQAVFL
jgi:glycerol-3-phosphate O-acyltransferase